MALDSQMPDFLKDNKEEITNDTLQVLAQLVNRLEEKEDLLEQKEKELEELKKSRDMLSQVDIPELLLSKGLSEIRLANGTKVIIKEDSAVTIKDKEKFYIYLKNNGEDDIIKLTFAFDRMASEMIEKLFEYLNSNSYKYKSENNIHYQTQAKYFRTKLGIGEEDRKQGIQQGYYLTPEQFSDFADIFIFHKTKLQYKKD
jgi:hypothetical protein